MRYIVIGDIHGCYEELLALLDAVHLQPDDVIVSVGDLIHKGPDSAKVVRYLRKVDNHTILAFANHEEKQFRWERHEGRISVKGGVNPVTYAEEFPEISRKLTRKDKMFLQDSYYWFKLPGNHLVIHGGIPSSLQRLPSKRLHSQTNLNAKDKKLYGRILRLRWEDQKSKPVMLGEESETDTYWASTYDGRFGQVLFGHNPFKQDRPKEFSYATGLDLGAAQGWYLCALLLNAEGNRLGHQVIKTKHQYAIPWQKR
jgi:hypothetical protein